MKTLSFHETLAMNPDAGGVRYCIRNKNELTDNNEKICSYFIDSFPRYRFYRQWSSQRPPVSVGVKSKTKTFLKLTDKM